MNSSENCGAGGCGATQPEEDPMKQKPKPLLLINTGNLGGFRDFMIGMTPESDGEQPQEEPEEGEAGGFRIKVASPLYQDNYTTLEQMKTTVLDRSQTIAETQGCYVLGNGTMFVPSNKKSKLGVINPSTGLTGEKYNDMIERLTAHFRNSRKILLEVAIKAAGLESIEGKLVSYSVLCRPFQDPIHGTVSVKEISATYRADRVSGDTPNDHTVDFVHHLSVQHDDREHKLLYVKTQELIRAVNPRASGMCSLLEEFIESENQRKDAIGGEG